MPVRTINLVEDNTAPPLQLTLEREGVAINITDCTVNLIIARGNTITNADHQECTIVSAVAGEVSYAIDADDFASPGTYKADIEITYADASVERLYDQLKIKARRKLS